MYMKNIWGGSKTNVLDLGFGGIRIPKKQHRLFKQNTKVFGFLRKKVSLATFSSSVFAFSPVHADASTTIQN